MKLNAKRLLSLVLALLLVFSLAACGQTSSTQSEDTSGNSEDAAAAEFQPIDYDKYFDENGYWIGVTASDLVQLPEDYKSVVVPADAIAVSEEELQEAIDNIISNFPITSQITDRAVEDGDKVNIDYVGSVDGVEFDGGNTNGNGTDVTAGSTQYIDDFLTQIIGHKPGETFDVNVTFPEDYGVENLNGKDAVFVTTINYITESVDPELTDAFVAENLSEYYENVSTVEELKAYLNEQLAADKQLDYVYNYILDGSELLGEIPQLLMDYQEEDMLSYYNNYASMYGVSLEEFLKSYIGVDSAAALVEEAKESMEAYAKQYLVYQAIAEAESLKVDDNALAAYMLEATGSEDYSSYEEKFGKNYLIWNALSYSSFHVAADNAVVE